MKDNPRKFLIVGNWKMNKTLADAKELAGEIVDMFGRETETDVLICPPFTALAPVAKAIENSNILLGAQNMYHEPAGSFTGEISAAMLRDLFVTYVILGHSERRHILNESDQAINLKVQMAIKSNLKPIICVGESLEEHEAEETHRVISKQLEANLAKLPKNKADQIVIAYEPVWAIGTGKAATPEVAQEVHSFIRSLLSEMFGASKANKIRILYGGSVKPDNIEELLQQPDIDGALIGGASLEFTPFLKIIKKAMKLQNKVALAEV